MKKNPKKTIKYILLSIIAAVLITYMFRVWYVYSMDTTITIPERWFSIVIRELPAGIIVIFIILMML